MPHYGNLIVTGPDGQQETVGLDRPLLTFGRDRDNDLHLDDAAVSRHHGRIECGADGCAIVDLDSANGVEVNGKKVKRAPLAGNEIIQVGRYQLFYISPRTPVMAMPPPDAPDAMATAHAASTIVQPLPKRRRPAWRRVALALLLLALVAALGLALFGRQLGLDLPPLPWPGG